MSEQSWVVVETVTGSLQAELLRGLLEAQGIEVILSQEGAGRALGLEVGLMGEVNMLVPIEGVQQAREVIENYYAGTYKTPNETDEG